MEPPTLPLKWEEPNYFPPPQGEGEGEGGDNIILFIAFILIKKATVRPHSLLIILSAKEAEIKRP
jgi:hypothetical protein